MNPLWFHPPQLTLPDLLSQPGAWKQADLHPLIGIEVEFGRDPARLPIRADSS